MNNLIRFAPLAHPRALRKVFRFLLLLAASACLMFLVTTSTPKLAQATSDPLILAWSSFEIDSTTSVAWGDYDGDGDLDLLAAGTSCDSSCSFLRLYRNDEGTLTASAAWSSTESDNTTSVAWGDYDGDGDLDLLVAGTSCGFSCSFVRLYRNDGVNDNGNPIFTLVWSSTETKYSTTSVAWGDYDGDTDLDIAAGTGLYCNGGVDSNGAPLFTLVLSSISGGAWGDYDGDGDLDLVTSTGIYRNDGAGSNCAPPVFTLASSLSSGVWGDYDGDGDLDLAAGAQVYRNDGVANDGTPMFILVWNLDLSGGPTSDAWGDYDSDGDLDIAVGEGPGDVDVTGLKRLYRNDSVAYDGTQGFSLVWSSAEYDDTRSVAWGDYDGDGDLDLVAGNVDAPIRLYRNDGGTLAVSAPWYPSANPSASSETVAWGDYDGDSDLDLVTAYRLYTDYLYRNDSGALTASSVWSPEDFDGTTSLAWGDVDGDGDLDLAMGNTDLYDYVCGCYVSSPTRLYRNDNGLLTNGPVWSSVETDSTYSVAWGDYDNDGDLDLVVGNSDAPNRLYRNDTAGITPTLTLAWSATITDTTWSVAWGDYDNDGDLDLAVGNSSAPNRLYRNDTADITPTLTLAWSAAITDATSSVAWGDVDGDGDLDLAVGNGGIGYGVSQPNRLYRNDGGMLTTTAVWSTVEADITTSVAWGDADGDGDLDLAAGNYGFWGQPTRVYRNDVGTLTASGAWSMNQSDNVESLAWGDVDGDGDLDLAMAENYREATTWLYLNNRDARLGPGAIPLVGITRPGPNADFYSVARILVEPAIPITYTLFDPQGDRVKSVRAYYSLNGDGQWLPAVAATGTITTNLDTTAYFTRTYTNTTATSITGTSLVTSTLILTPTDAIADIDVRVNLSHTWDADVVMTLTAPFGRSVLLVNGRGNDGDDFAGTVFDDEALVSTVTGTAPFAGRYRPEQVLARFDGYPLAGTWTLVISDTYPWADNGTLLSWNITATLNSGRVYTYVWDVAANGLFGQSDNVVFRIEAIPAVVTGTANATPGPYLYGRYASQTFPFRVRGTQVRVMRQDGSPAANALVYRLPVTQTVGGSLYTNLSGVPFHTDSQGYLQGRGQLNIGDRLVALLPILVTDTHTLYYTSATPTLTGLNLYAVTTAGVQTLTVSSANPLILFNLDISLEWDASKDQQYLEQLKFNLQRASEVLYDVTNGQAALGNVTIYQDREHWNEAMVRIYANNKLRPFAAIGGIVITPTVEPVMPTIVYNPGQVSIGATWNRYGDAGVTVGEDWPRTLAHELGHYLFFQDDDYLGLNASGQLIRVNLCTGTLMSDPYRDDYSELKRTTEWLPGCANTLANKSTGRSDWATVTKFYAWLHAPGPENLGPSSLPLAVTQIKIVEPITATQVLDDPRFYLKDAEGGSLQPGNSARAFLFKPDGLVDLGRPVVDQVLARGAEPGDRVCVFELAAGRQGCKVIVSNDNQQLSLADVPNWQPEVIVRPVTSVTVQVTVTVSAPLTGAVVGKLYERDGGPPAEITLTQQSTTTYIGTFNLVSPTLEAYVDVQVVNDGREIVTDYALGGNPANQRSGFANQRSGFANQRSGFAPVLSGDGQAILYELGLTFPQNEFYTLQAATLLPDAPEWATPVGRGYWLSKSEGAPDLAGATISLSYAQNEVPSGEENYLKMYYWNRSVWTPLTTTVETADNSAFAPVQGEGLYALMSTIEITLRGPGWDAFAYPLQVTKTVTNALESLNGLYTTVYWYNSDDAVDSWKMYDVDTPGWVNDLNDLRFGEAYWINVTTTTVILRFSGGSASSPQQAAALPSEASSNFQMPPATYYGPVLPGEGFMPTVGMTVTAWVNGVQCGQGKTLEVGGQIVYSVNVSADGPGAEGCGATGRVVTFTVGSRSVVTTAVWDNNRPKELALITGARLYLPVIRR